MTNPNHSPDMPRCGAHTRTGGTCKNLPMKGATRCRMHGGSSPQARAKAAGRVQEAKARRAVELFAARRDIEPGPALLELVQWTAGEVDYWRQEVRALEKADLTWGMTREKTGGSDPESGSPGTDSGPADVRPEVTREAKPNIAYVMLTDASNRLAQYAVAALRAGVAERAIQLAEQQGALVADVIRAILADLNLTPVQQELVATVVPAHLRAITGGAA